MALKWNGKFLVYEKISKVCQPCSQRTQLIALVLRQPVQLDQTYANMTIAHASLPDNCFFFSGDVNAIGLKCVFYSSLLYFSNTGQKITAKAIRVFIEHAKFR